jgi:hypothetical protein
MLYRKLVTSCPAKHAKFAKGAGFEGDREDGGSVNRFFSRSVASV